MTRKPKTTRSEIALSNIRAFNRQFRAEHFALLSVVTFGLAVALATDVVSSAVADGLAMKLLLWSSGATLGLATGVHWGRDD